METKIIHHRNITVYGFVQGVFFRQAAKEQADQLGLTGFVRNQSDGTVYLEAEGVDEELDKFLEWCKTGPPFSRVEHVSVSSGMIRNYRDFRITTTEVSLS
jgi:acylphosphatase